MRRPTIFALVGAVLVIGIGAYSALWWIAAGKIATAAEAWRQSPQAQQLGASWQKLSVVGYPFSFRIELSGAALEDAALNPPVKLHAPTMSAGVWPWDFRDISLAAPDGIAGMLGGESAPLAKVDAQRGSGAIALANDGGITVWLSLYQAKADAGVAIAARAVDAWVIVPAHAPTSDQEAGLAVAADLRDLVLPAAPPGFKDTIDELGFGVTMKGAFPRAPLHEAAAAWRDAGGTAELDTFRLRWGDMSVNGSGTLSLDNNLQPIGALSGGIAGFDQLLTALTSAGRIKSNDARIARLALAMLTTPGPDGRPQIATSLTIQNGEMFLGPAKLGKAPHIDW